MLATSYAVDPRSVASLLARCGDTYANYLGYARVGCLLMGAPDRVFDHKALRRAKMAIVKRGAFTPRCKYLIQLCTLQRIVPLLLRAPQWKSIIMWILTAYVFLLRCVVAGTVRGAPGWKCHERCVAGFPLSAFRWW